MKYLRRLNDYLKGKLSLNNIIYLKILSTTIFFVIFGGEPVLFLLAGIHLAVMFVRFCGVRFYNDLFDYKKLLIEKDILGLYLAPLVTIGLPIVFLMASFFGDYSIWIVLITSISVFFDWIRLHRTKTNYPELFEE